MFCLKGPHHLPLNAILILISFHRIKDKLQVVSPRKRTTFETKRSLQNLFGNEANVRTKLEIGIHALHWQI